MSAAAARELTKAARPGLVGAAALVVVTIAWAAVVITGYAGLTVVPQLRLITFALPAVLVGACLFARRRAPRTLLVCAGLAATLSAAMFTAERVPADWRIAYGAPALALMAVISKRWPQGAVVGAFALTGTYHAVSVYTPVPAHGTTDLLLAGLWAATLWGWLLSKRERPLWIWPSVALVLLYLLITLAQAMSADSLEQGLTGFRFSGWYMLAFVLVAYAGFTPDALVRISRGVVLVAGAVGGYALLRWLIGPADRELDSALAAGGQYLYVEGELRNFGSFQQGHAMAAWSAPVGVFCLSVALSSSEARWRALAGAAAGLCGFAVLTSAARVGLIALVCGVIVVLSLYQLSRGFPGLRIGVTATAFVCAVGVTVTAFTLAIDSEETRSRYTILATPEKDPSVQRRLQKWEETLVAVRDAPFGAGIGTSGNAEHQYGRFVTLASFNVDSSYLKVAFEQGIFLLALFVASALFVLHALIRRALMPGQEERAGMVIGAAAALVGLLVLGAAGTYTEGLPALAVWLLVGLGVGQYTSVPADGG